MKTKLFHRFQDLPKNYRELIDAAAQESIFISRNWFELFIDSVVNEASQVLLLGVEDSTGQAASLLPLWSKPAPFHKPQHLDALGNYYTPLFMPILSPDKALAEAGLFETARSLAYDFSGHWDVIQLAPLDKNAWHHDVIVKAFSAVNVPVEEYVAFANWYLVTQGMSFDDYVSTRSSIMKNTIKRKEKQIKKAYEQFDMIIVDDEEHLPMALSSYQQVYHASWKQHEPYPEFIPNLAAMAANLGWLRLGVALLDNTPVAAQLWLVGNNTAYIFKLAYDQAYEKLSVGTLLTMKLIEHSMKVDNVHTIDFLSGDDAYKKAWMSHRRERVGIELVNPRSLRGRGLIVKHAVETTGRTLVKHLRPFAATKSRVQND